MSRPIAISLSPNTEPDDIRLAWKVLTTPALWHDKKILSQVQGVLGQRLHGQAVLFSSGRAALAAALRALHVGVGDEVIVQAFTCVAVPAAVSWVGAKPVYADIDARTYNFSVESVRQNISPKTKAIIIQHTFGIPGPIEEIMLLARQHNLAVIEDCAHALGGAYKGQDLGTFGDAAIVSFGRDKVVSSVFGGAAVARDANVAARLREQQRGLQDPPASWIVQQLVHPILFSWLLPIYTSGVGKAVLIGLQQLRVLSKAVEPLEKRGLPPHHANYAFPPALGQLILHQLHKLDRFTARRQEISARYMRELAGKADMPAVDDRSSPAWLRFPILTPHRAAIVAAARRRGIVLGDWYRPAVAPLGVDTAAIAYNSAACPVAEEASAAVINLPTYPLLTDDQVMAVIDLFAE
jgi:dTDP-4-amino-4,6-dideoxygalactose transaminase